MNRIGSGQLYGVRLALQAYQQQNNRHHFRNNSAAVSEIAVEFSQLELVSV